MILLILVFSYRSSNAITNYVSKFQVNQFIKIQGKTHFLKGVETNGRGNILLDGPGHRWTQKWTKCDRSTQIKVNRNYIVIRVLCGNIISKIKQYLESFCEIERVMFRRRLYLPVKRNRFMSIKCLL